MKTQTTRQYSGTLIALAFCMALFLTGFAMILPLFARRFESFGAGVKALGVSSMVYALASAVAAPFIGMLADRLGRRPIIIFSIAAYAVTSSGYLFAKSAGQLIVLRGLTGIFTIGPLLLMTTIVGDLAPENRRGQWMGIVMGGSSAGYIIGPYLGGLLFDRFDYVVPFTISILMVIGAVLLAVFLIPETYTTVNRPSHSMYAWARELMVLPARTTLLLILLITFGVVFAYSFVEPQFMFYAYDDLSWTSAQLGMVMSIYGCAFMLGEFALGHLSDRLGRKPVVVLGLALFSIQFVGLIIYHDVSWIAMSFLLAGLGNAIYDPALSASILDITPPEHTAGMMGLKGTAGSLGNVLGPALVVMITPTVSPQGVFLIAAALVWMLILVSELFLHLPKRADVSDQFSKAAV